VVLKGRLVELKPSITLPTERLKEAPYASVLCYPKPSEIESTNRVEELEKLGVEEVEFSGKASAFNLPILGKGYVGVVVIARRYSQRVALKVRRVDADRPNLLHEAAMLAKANAAGVGPALVEASQNFLLMQLIEGDLLPSWLETNKDKSLVRQVLGEVVEQCWHLDLIGLDHGELSKAPKHIIVDRTTQPWILDFETSSDTRKAANVTALCQYFAMSGGTVPRILNEILGDLKREVIIEALRSYKKEKTRENLDSVIQVCLLR
jgi:putative serine/threonine protein kinase